ncbi:MAG: outer membrane beta-barrel protein [Alphaproteobacteria bacterium]|nr:outer membrane beta-barrel protein [Alphaproteobacteria bacterium]
MFSKFLSTAVLGSLCFDLAHCYDDQAKNSYAGWYFGAGVSYQYTKGEAIIQDNFPAMVRADAGAWRGETFIKANAGKVGGTLAFGYGNYITGNCYLGGELDLDLAGSRSSSGSDDINQMAYLQRTLKTRGIVPTIAVRLGGYIPSIDGLLYARVGFTFLNNKLRSFCFKKEFSTQKITPIIGAGIEKNITDNCSMRIEGDYRFPANKKYNQTEFYDRDGVLQVIPYKAYVNNKVRGYAVRVICTYHF